MRYLLSSIHPSCMLKLTDSTCVSYIIKALTRANTSMKKPASKILKMVTLARANLPQTVNVFFVNEIEKGTGNASETYCVKPLGPGKLDKFQL